MSVVGFNGNSTVGQPVTLLVVCIVKNQLGSVSVRSHRDYVSTGILNSTIGILYNSFVQYFNMIPYLTQ